MKNVEILIVGGGPAGLCAAKTAASLGASVLICERDEVSGGQLFKQTHKFFGSAKQYAGDRGNAIGDFLLDEVKKESKIEVMQDTTIIGIYEDGVVLGCSTSPIEQNEKIIKINPKK